MNDVEIRDGQHAIWIRDGKMNFGTRKRVEGAAVKVQPNGTTEVSMDMGMWQLALMAFNITRWAGPLLNGKTISISTLEKLDASLDPLLERVLEAVAERNKQEETIDPNSTSTGAPSLTESEAAPVVNTTSTSL